MFLASDIYNIGCQVSDGNQSCYYLSKTKGNFDDMTQFCKARNMQMVVLETFKEYQYIADIVKKSKNCGVLYSEKYTNVIIMKYLN